MNEKPTVIAVIPGYSHTGRQNVFSKVRMPPVGPIAVLSQIAPDTHAYAIDENNYGGPRDHNGMPDHAFLQERDPARLALFYGGMSNAIPRVFALARQYKRFGAKTVAGGSHVDALPEEALSSGIDVVVHGEGEATMKELLPRLLGGHGLEHVQGISFLKNGERVFTGIRPPAHLEDLCQTDLTLIKHLERRWTRIPINRGRGCNWNCEFCVVNKQYGRYKAVSTQRVFRDVVRYADLGYKGFFFTDDNFAQDAKGTIELCRLLSDYQREFGKKLSFFVQVRSDVAEDDQLLAAMRQANVTNIAIGFESPINEELRAMRKGVTVERLVRRSRKLAEYFYIHGMFIFGYPAKHASGIPLEERAKAYQRFFKAARIDTIQVLNAIPLPGSELRARLGERVFPTEMVGWDKYDGNFLCYDPAPLDPYELERLPRALMRKRYLGPLHHVNYYNWANWTYNTIGFPLQFSAFYAKRFAHNLLEKRRRERFDEHSIFHEPLVRAWRDIKRRWRTLAIKTYAGQTIRAWYREQKSARHDMKASA